MPLEATMIVVDNSDYMRNGDYLPSRIVVQNESVNMICQSKRQSNPENTVGLITLSDSNVLSTLTSDFGRINNRLHLVEFKSSSEFCKTVKIAHLALKHRQIRNQKMKIVVFIGSPINDSQSDLIQLAKKLRKENVSVDIICFGENDLNQEKLNAFVESLNSSDGNNSKILYVPPGTNLKESLRSSSIMGEQPYSGMADNDDNFEMDGTEDPDLLYALRVSMEDQRMRQQAESKLTLNADPQPDPSAMTEDEQLAYAIKMSMDANQMETDSSKPQEGSSQQAPQPMEEEFLDNLIESEQGKKKDEDSK